MKVNCPENRVKGHSVPRVAPKSGNPWQGERSLEADVTRGCQFWGPESGSLSPLTGFQADENRKALTAICQGSLCLGSGAVTWDTATAMAAAVGHQPWEGYFRFRQAFPAPLA